MIECLNREDIGLYPWMDPVPVPAVWAPLEPLSASAPAPAAAFLLVYAMAATVGGVAFVGREQMEQSWRLSTQSGWSSRAWRGPPQKLDCHIDGRTEFRRPARRSPLYFSLGGDEPGQVVGSWRLGFPVTAPKLDPSRKATARPAKPRSRRGSARRRACVDSCLLSTFIMWLFKLITSLVITPCGTNLFST